MENIARGRGLEANIALGFASGYISFSTMPFCNIFCSALAAILIGEYIYVDKVTFACYELQVFNDVASILFCLLILRGISDSQGNVWRCHPSQLYAVEITLPQQQVVVIKSLCCDTFTLAGANHIFVSGWTIGLLHN